MQLQVILTSIVLATSLMVPQVSSAKFRAAPKSVSGDPILEMNDAFKRQDRKRLTQLLPKVKGHVLEPWGAYWELSARLDAASPQEVQAFFSQYAGTYQEDRLRNEWLLQLGKRRDWNAFLAEYPQFRMNDDNSVRCYALMAQSATQGVDVSAQVQLLWLAQREADEGCAAAAEQQLKAERLTPLTVWQRARLGVEFDKPRVATQAVSLLNPEWIALVNSVYNNPNRYLDDKYLALRPRTKELVTLAIIRLASNNPAAAAEELDKLRWRTQLTHEERSWIWGVIGKKAARNLSNQALGYYSQGQDNHMHSDQLVRKIRAALRAGNWVQVQSTIAALDEARRQEPSWVYWRARALTALQVPDAAVKAQALYKSIAAGQGFYEQLAQEELGQAITLPPAPAPLTEEEKQAARKNAGLQRALYAIKNGLRSEGVREWNYTTNLHQPGGMPDRELIAASQLACEQQVWDRCINSSDRTKALIDQTQRFPTPYLHEVKQLSSKIGLEPAFVYGLIRQESRFITDAQSNVGASGLMQVMPATARWTARKVGMANFKPQQLTEREVNLSIGTSYLKLVLDSFEGSMPLAAAAYNAGPSRSKLWRGQSGDPVLEAAIWAENIPFPETRDYVKKVLSNTTQYAALLTGQTQSLKARLGTVGPATSPATPVAPEEELP